MRGTAINKEGKLEKNQKVMEGDCVFPFKYQWKEHNNCTDTDKGEICATSVTDRGTLKTYGYCNKTSLKKSTKKKALTIHKTRKKRKLKIVDKFPTRSKSKSSSKPSADKYKSKPSTDIDNTNNTNIKILSKGKVMNKTVKNTQSLVEAKETIKKNTKKNGSYKDDINRFKNDGLDALKLLSEKQIATMLSEASTAYYNEIPIMTDNEFDIVKEYVEEKFPKNKVLEQIGAPIQEKNKVKLPYNMPSMDKIKPDTDALPKWKAKYAGPYILSAKLDGISAMYSTENKKRKLYTRGNGSVGQDISHLIPYLKLPSTDDITIRGELIMKKSVFSQKYENNFSNSRNLVAGIVGKKKIDQKRLQDIDFVAYEVIKPVLKPSQQMSFLKDQQVITVVNEERQDIDNSTLSEVLIDWRENYKYTIDGVIVTNDQIYSRTNKNPEYGFAFKMVLSDQVAEAKVVNVLWSPSKDGYLKPRIQIEPVVLGGAKIEYATAFNAAFVEDNKLGIGAVVTLVCSGTSRKSQDA